MATIAHLYVPNLFQYLVERPRSLDTKKPLEPFDISNIPSDSEDEVENPISIDEVVRRIYNNHSTTSFVPGYTFMLTVIYLNYSS